MVILTPKNDDFGHENDDFGHGNDDFMVGYNERKFHFAVDNN